MNNFYACQASDDLTWGVLDFLFSTESRDKKSYLYTDNKENFLFNLLPRNESLFIIDHSDLEKLPQITNFYALSDCPSNKKIIEKLNPENVFFNFKNLSRKSKILTEEEVYYLKFFKSDTNLFTLPSILSIKSKDRIIGTTTKPCAIECISIIIENISNTNEIFFWRKLTTFLSTKKPVKIYSDKNTQEILLGYGDLPQVKFSNDFNIEFLTNTHWLSKNGQWDFIFNINNISASVFTSKSFNANKAPHGPNVSYIECDFQINEFELVKKYFNTLLEKSENKNCISWDKKLETWSTSSCKPLEFDELIAHLYFLYWNFYLKEKELSLNGIRLAPSVNQINISQFLKSLITIHNLMSELKQITKNETSVTDFEKLLRYTNGHFIKEANKNLLLIPLYTTFSVTNTASRNLSFNDILNFYFKKADDIQLLTTVLFELLTKLSNQNKITINL